ncbi:MAG: rod shape-determining protein [Oscillospiraceae bacterium]|nr:rod shape-determining protein [Oscillospiraceae bacterium]
MAKFDIGIDLGTTKVIIYVYGKGIVLEEPSVVAVNNRTDTVVAFGDRAYRMIGRTPEYITATNPLKDGVVSNLRLTEIMIKDILKRVCDSMLLKPRVAVCIPSVNTEVEKRAVIDAVNYAGAREVYLVKEPIAAAIGAGLDISKPIGRFVADIGGGTTDVAVISLCGIVAETSVKSAGNALDGALKKYVLQNHKLMIGDRTASEIKIRLGNMYNPSPENTYTVKGRNLVAGLPGSVVIDETQVFEALFEPVMVICRAVKDVIERTSPELVGDIYRDGLVLTGGGALLRGLPEFLSERINASVKVADNPVRCVAIGTGNAFNYMDNYDDGFLKASLYKY